MISNMCHFPHGPICSQPSKTCLEAMRPEEAAVKPHLLHCMGPLAGAHLCFSCLLPLFSIPLASFSSLQGLRHLCLPQGLCSPSLGNYSQPPSSVCLTLILWSFPRNSLPAHPSLKCSEDSVHGKTFSLRPF